MPRSKRNGEEVHLSASISTYHKKLIDNRVDEQGISRSEAIRQIIRDASLGRFGVVWPAVQEIRRALNRLRRIAPATPDAVEAIRQIEQAVDSLLDG